MKRIQLGGVLVKGKLLPSKLTGPARYRGLSGWNRQLFYPFGWHREISKRSSSHMAKGAFCISQKKECGVMLDLRWIEEHHKEVQEIAIQKRIDV